MIARTAADITPADLAPTFGPYECWKDVLVNASGTLRVTLENEDGCVVLAGLSVEPATVLWGLTFSGHTPAALVFAAIEAAS